VEKLLERRGLSRDVPRRRLPASKLQVGAEGKGR